MKNLMQLIDEYANAKADAVEAIDGSLRMDPNDDTDYYRQESLARKRMERALGKIKKLLGF